MPQPLPPSEDLRPWFEVLADLRPPVDWADLFGREAPVEIDVGCGRGMFLVNAGTAAPDRNFLGIEIDYREARHGARRLVRRNLSNVRIWGGDARIAFEEFVPPASLAAVHVYFPDPWWKRKHRRRRVFNDHLADLMADALVDGGAVHSWTDVGEYFEVIAALMDHHVAFEREETPPDHPPAHDLDYHTSYDRKRRQAGCTIHRGLWRRRPRSAAPGPFARPTGVSEPHGLPEPVAAAVESA